MEKQMKSLRKLVAGRSATLCPSQSSRGEHILSGTLFGGAHVPTTFTEAQIRRCIPFINLLSES